MPFKLIGPPARDRNGEMLCGLLVGSLPWLPRFFCHFRPKVAVTYYKLYASRLQGSSPDATSIGREKHFGSWEENRGLERNKQGSSVMIYGNAHGSSDGVPPGAMHRPQDPLDRERGGVGSEIRRVVSIEQISERRC